MRNVFVSALIFTAAACGTTTNGGGATTVGGSPGSTCNSATVSGGCSGNQIVACQNGVWTATGTCTAPQYCQEVADPAGTSASQKKGQCTTPATTVQDTVGGSSGDGFSISIDIKTDLAGLEQCVEQKCNAEYNACLTNIACKTYVTCYNACLDTPCKQTCADAVKTNPAVKDVLDAMSKCAEKVLPTCGG